jgi:hypothetical protein
MDRALAEVDVLLTLLDRVHDAQMMVIALGTDRQIISMLPVCWYGVHAARLWFRAESFTVQVPRLVAGPIVVFPYSLCFNKNAIERIPAGGNCPDAASSRPLAARWRAPAGPGKYF